MSYIVVKRTIRKYEVTFVRRFMTYAKFREARRGMENTPRVCFYCGEKFKDDEHIYLGMVKNSLNQIFCECCGERISNVLSQKENKKED